MGLDLLLLALAASEQGDIDLGLPDFRDRNDGDEEAEEDEDDSDD